MSRTAAIREARRVEHRGMSRKEIQRYEGRLGALARYGRRKGYHL